MLIYVHTMSRRDIIWYITSRRQKMQEKHRRAINIRKSVKYDPIFEEVQRISDLRKGHKFTPILMELLDLGVHAYYSGLRVVEDQLQNVKNQSNVMNVDREVARSVFTGLAGALVDIKRYEKSKKNPNPEKIKFYDLAAKALFFEHDRFRHFTNLDVQKVFDVIAPILKSLRLTPSELKQEQIVEDNRLILQKLIDSTKVTDEL